ncbi:MAG: right-handed parallel beta-helix repeat-containing protein [Acidimicrobiales bacterium]
MTQLLRKILLVVGFAMIASSCGGGSSSTSDDAPDDTEAPQDSAVTTEPDFEVDVASYTTLNVPDDYPSIQAAVDAAAPGDLILIAEGSYLEAVDVVTDDLVIRGVDRNAVILDGGFELENGIRVLGADGVAVENLTAQNYTKNGFFWTSDVTGYRGSYLTAIRNGDYGVYAFGARDGLLEHSYASGSPDAGFYIGQCFPCTAVIDDVISEYNGLGYSGTDSGGDLYIINSVWRHNRAGIVPNSGSYEGCAPERETTVVGNLVYSNSNPDTSAIDAALLAMGNGIVISGGVANTVERNRIWDHDVSGIAITPFPEDNPVHGIPAVYPTDCLENTVPANPEDAAELPATLFWESMDNVVRENVIVDSRIADIVLVQTKAHGNRFCDNEISSSLPADIETLAPCEGELLETGGEAFVTFLGLIEEVRPPSVDYTIAEIGDPGPQPNMADALTAKPSPARTPKFPDVTTIGVPDAPE